MRQIFFQALSIAAALPVFLTTLPVRKRNRRYLQVARAALWISFPLHLWDSLCFRPRQPSELTPSLVLSCLGSPSSLDSQHLSVVLGRRLIDANLPEALFGVAFPLPHFR
ncbi:hypothetical protein EDB92DRAFT_484981 [Lactarius akahatsu]|uniref:Uncharacterized protein n=1 Tax=Lactarius akahatsu TaxID=416441 RepID=A0AAD4LUH9_9AGAM|nr:hypothetical protein EDB92DRAFT_484981 [Lactarius akahatsu]